MSLFENDEFQWRETYFILFDANRRPLASDLQKQLKKLDPRYEVRDVRADEAGRFESLTLFGLGASWGGFESLVLPAIPHARRGLDRQPDQGRLVRLHIGLEDPEDLTADLHHALGEL